MWKRNWPLKLKYHSARPLTLAAQLKISTAKIFYSFDNFLCFVYFSYSLFDTEYGNFCESGIILCMLFVDTSEVVPIPELICFQQLMHMLMCNTLGNIRFY
jgi:hypothetical protein